MKKIYYLSTCDTCKKIMKELEPSQEVLLQDIKKEPVTEAQLEELKELSGSYEALFSKRAQLYKQRNLKNRELSEEDYRRLLLEHYTFLKRPVIVVDGDIFMGNAKSTVAKAKEKLDNYDI